MYLPFEAYSVISNTTTSMHCVAQRYAALVTARCVSELQSTVEQNGAMIDADVVRHAKDSNYGF